MPTIHYSGVILKKNGQDNLDFFLNEDDEVVITNDKEDAEHVFITISKEDWILIVNHFKQQYGV